MSDPIIDIMLSEQITPTPRVKTVCDAIAARHEDRVQAFVYYGSSLRDMDNPDKMLDFYVIVDSYRKTHNNPIRALLNALIPPAVYYHEMIHADGVKTTCKYSIMSIKAFENRCSPRALLSMTWGRFAQPCIILFPINETIKSRLFNARRQAVTHMAAQIAPLLNSPVSSTAFWARGFRESYRTELRPESSDGRSVEIVEKYAERYAAILTALYGPPETENDLYTLPNASAGKRFSAEFKWFLRRLLGKPLGGIRVINSAATFDGGLDYIMHKLSRHSGVTIDVTPSQRRHPILWSPVLAWKLYRKGAFR